MAPLEIPPFAVLAATLRKTTEHLACELTQPSRSPPDWTDLEWAIARSSAAMQGISVLLANRLQWSGPPLWQSFLAEQVEQSLLCHSRIGALLERMDAATREAQVNCVKLKGAALRALNLYAPGERPMGDIDLLVGKDDLAAVDSVLRTLDYVPAFSSRRHDVFEPRIKSAPCSFGEHIGNPLKVEIHTKVAEPLPVDKIDITNCLQSTQAQPGLNAYPSLAALMLHLLLHTAGNMRAHALRQIQLHDIAALARRLSDADWRTLLVEPNTRDSRWWLFPPLALTERYYAGSIPPDALRASRAACPRALRLATDRQALTNLSWSNLRIHAFPGITWARTPMESLRFIRSRLLPGRTALAELAQTRQAQPQLDEIPWYGVSHGNRILRWIFSRPPRVQTMISVKAALDSASLLSS